MHAKNTVANSRGRRVLGIYVNAMLDRLSTLAVEK